MDAWLAVRGRLELVWPLFVGRVVDEEDLLSVSSLLR